MKIRSMITSLLPVVALSFLSGCIIEAAPAPGTPQSGKMEIVEMDSTSPIQMASGLADSKPPHAHAGAAMSYWVWQAPRNEWHIRSTTAHQLHRFQGRIRPLQSASLTNLKATRLEWGDRMRLEGRDIAFDFSTQGGEDGFDFTLNGNACVEMDLLIDSSPHPKLVVIGKGEQNPASNHFIVCP